MRIRFVFDGPNAKQSSMSAEFLSDSDTAEGNGNKTAAKFSAVNRYGELVHFDKFTEVDLRHADMRNVEFVGEGLRYADLSGANMRRSVLRNADLRNAKLDYANLIVSDFSGANLRRASFHGADMRFMNLSGADLKNADLSGADLRHSNLSGALLNGAVLDGADMRWVQRGDACSGDTSAARA